MRALVVVAAAVAVLTVVAGVLRVEPERAPVIARGFAAPPPSDVIEAAIGTEPQRLGVSGDLISINETGMTVEAESGPVFVRFAGDTRFCRAGCEVDWRALRPGDRISSGTTLGLGEEKRVADWVDANVTSGYGDVMAVDGAQCQLC
jgi:hypothetical protein